jgi:hypothetical protein
MAAVNLQSSRFSPTTCCKPFEVESF